MDRCGTVNRPMSAAHCILMVPPCSVGPVYNWLQAFYSLKALSSILSRIIRWLESKNLHKPTDQWREDIAMDPEQTQDHVSGVEESDQELSLEEVTKGALEGFNLAQVRRPDLSPVSLSLAPYCSFAMPAWAWARAYR